MCTKGWLQLLATRQLKETVQTAAMRHGINTEEETAEYMCWLSHGYPNDVEGTGNDKDIKSTGSDLTLMTIKIIRVGSNQEYQRLCSSMKTLDQVFISIERDNASVDTSSNQKGLENIKEQWEVIKTEQGAYNNNPSLFEIKRIQTTLFPTFVSDLVQLVCGEISQVH